LVRNLKQERFNNLGMGFRTLPSAFVERSDVPIQRQSEPLDVLHKAFQNVAFTYIGGTRNRPTIPEHVRADPAEQIGNRHLGEAFECGFNYEHSAETFLRSSKPPNDAHNRPETAARSGAVEGPC
jgi:hypothetical protein